MTSDPFTSHTYIDKRTGEIYRKYSYKRKPCNRLVLTSRIAEQLAGYSLIEKDLRSCIVWLNEIERRHNEGPSSDEERYSHGRDRDNYNLIKGLFVAVLTFYAKCFTRCEGRRIKLDRTNVVPEFHELHDRCMSFRHNFAAHSGAEKLERARIVVAYPTAKRGRTPIKLFRELDQPDLFWTREGEVGIRQLVDHVRGFVDDKIEQLATKVQEEEAPRAIADVLGTRG